MESFWIHIAMVLFCHIRVIMKTYYTTEAVVRAKKFLRTQCVFLWQHSRGIWLFKASLKIAKPRCVLPPRKPIKIFVDIDHNSTNSHWHAGQGRQHLPTTTQKTVLLLLINSVCGWGRFLLINSFEFLPAFGTKTRRTSKKHLFSITAFRKSIGMQLNDTWTLLHVETNQMCRLKEKA